MFLFGDTTHNSLYQKTLKEGLYVTYYNII
nr:MAG TPA: hypothetical protein [Caudoviricetes sp.]